VAPSSKEIIGLDSIISKADRFEKILYERTILFRDQFSETDRLLVEMGKLLRPLVPDCSEAELKFRSEFRKIQAGPSRVKTIFSVLRYNNCVSSRFFRDTIIAAAERNCEDSWGSRKIALSYLELQDTYRAAEWFRRALAEEENPKLKAPLFYWLHTIRRMEGNFDAAARELESAMKAYPEWGESYLAMALLIRDASEKCAYSNFDKKASLWAGVDYLLIALNTDPNVENEATRLLYQFRENCPKPDELAHRGLKPGDTYPVHCWKEYVTTVKVY
jgi:tetratricopeptide (TPR) repeat protein